MRLGIDLGTTRTLVARVDRGNYPVVTFFDAEGDAHDHFPSVAAHHPERGLLFGFLALEAARTDDLRVIRSIKRRLAYPDVNTQTTMSIGGQPVPIVDVLAGFLTALRTAIIEQSSITDEFGADEDIETMIAVPAHAPGVQRYLTLEAFRRAGFDVLGVVNEPSAAGFEYTHRQPRTLNSKRTQVIIYDLGGGTFDSSLIRVDGTAHEVLDTAGNNRLGGDDFDVTLAQVALATIKRDPNTLDVRSFERLVDDSRSAKESINPQTRRLAIDVDGTYATVPVADFYAEAVSLVDRTVETMTPLIGGLDDQGQASLGDTEVAGIYLVGGASGLPLVARRLREQFGRRVHRSPYPAASTAIGLAIAADETAGFSLRDRLSRGFGVFREADDGQGISFDQIFDRTTVTGEDTFEVIRRYRPQHNIGWFRFVEYAHVDSHDLPTGDIVPFAELLFPYARELRGTDLTEVPVKRVGEGPMIEERYLIDPHGIVEVHVTDLNNNYTISRVLGENA
ncbi:Hsp70 family protein [Propionibacteriaceae bacterium G1746]|uniref:Hsp70 family protein n=1 Tax=Aestuariimicrobium sp. G57 TaxID=3418485 RepID=UPI003C1DD3B7